MTRVGRPLLTPALARRTLTYRWVCLGLLFVSGLLAFFTRLAPVVAIPDLRETFVLGTAGLGLLTIWPRFLLLGVWITMLFLYAGLARFEEARMEDKFAEDYRRFAGGRGRFFPGSPMHRLFERTFGRLRPRSLGWLVAYAACLIAGFSVASALHTYTRASASTLLLPAQNALVVSAWPESEDWMEGIF